MEINNLDTLQAETFFSITQTMTGSPDVPKIAMVQGFPGKFTNYTFASL